VVSRDYCGRWTLERYHKTHRHKSQMKVAHTSLYIFIWRTFDYVDEGNGIFVLSQGTSDFLPITCTVLILSRHLRRAVILFYNMHMPQ
jgi:hypothetical protein